MWSRCFFALVLTVGCGGSTPSPTRTSARTSSEAPEQEVDGATNELAGAEQPSEEPPASDSTTEAGAAETRTAATTEPAAGGCAATEIRLPSGCTPLPDSVRSILDRCLARSLEARGEHDGVDACSTAMSTFEAQARAVWTPRCPADSRACLGLAQLDLGTLFIARVVELHSMSCPDEDVCGDWQASTVSRRIQPATDELAGMARLVEACEGGLGFACLQLGLAAGSDRTVADPPIMRACDLGLAAACAEALRRFEAVRFTPEHARARGVLSTACDAGDLRACNGVGAMRERGLGGGEADLPEAGALYRRACGNAIDPAPSPEAVLGEPLNERVGGCINLAYFQANHPSAARAIDVRGSGLVPVLWAACQSEHGRACDALSRVRRPGPPVPRASALRALACEHGVQDVCRR